MADEQLTALMERSGVTGIFEGNVLTHSANIIAPSRKLIADIQLCYSCIGSPGYPGNAFNGDINISPGYMIAIGIGNAYADWSYIPGPIFYFPSPAFDQCAIETLGVIGTGLANVAAVIGARAGVSQALQNVARQYRGGLISPSLFIAGILALGSTAEVLGVLATCALTIGALLIWARCLKSG